MSFHRGVSSVTWAPAWFARARIDTHVCTTTIGQSFSSQAADFLLGAHNSVTPMTFCCVIHQRRSQSNSFCATVDL